mmetsp:Transcript_1976/g.7539  ORF Transcript_1976/g.7539 Transcript_1976/m.7539 type:complete len:88 (+) Transcript_1976:627-890(+)
MYNKTASFMPEAERKLVEGKTCCLLIGDSTGDLTMADGLEADRLRVGLLNEKVEERLQQYQELFDFVSINDAPLPEICFRAIGVEQT